MQDVPESPEERKQRRRARRWKRRARIIGPFLGIPLLMVTLAISVDLIEYQPKPERERLSDKPIPVEVLEKHEKAARNPGRSVSKASVISPSVMSDDHEMALDSDAIALDMKLPSTMPTTTMPLRRPTPPSSLRGPTPSGSR